MTDKPAYMIIGIDIHDDAAMAPYMEEAPPIVAAYGGEILVATDDVEALDGKFTRKRMAIIKFPSKAKALAFWNAADYKPMKELREAHSDQDNFLVEGI